MDEKIINEILERHSELFKALAKQEEIDKLLYSGTISHLESEALYHLLQNKEEIKKEVDAGHNTHYHLLPSHLPEIYLDNFKNKALNILKNSVLQYNLTPEQIHGTIIEENINNILGKDFLIPPK